MLLDLTAWLVVWGFGFTVFAIGFSFAVRDQTTDLTEFDCVQIGAHSELNALCCPQTHLFEDRVMKIDQVTIGSRVTLGPRCTVLYGAHVGDGAQLGPLTLVMKGESIPAGTRWHGLPAAPWR